MHLAYSKWLFSDLLYKNKASNIKDSARERYPFLLTKHEQMIYLSTRIKALGRAPTVRIANFALRWCKENIGVNNRKKYLPTWSIRKSYEPDLCGEYDDTDNEVLIYYDNIDDVRELIATCIHEWTHQKQPITTKYFKYPGSYSRNPYERQARYNEKKYTRPLWEAIKHKVNKTNNGVRNK